MIKKILLISLLFISSCGYKPIYLGKDQLKIQFNEIILEGDIKINNQIVSNLNIKQSLLDEKKLIIRSRYEIEPTSKNSKGQDETYRSSINTILIIKENEKITNTKNLTTEALYGKKNNKFELTKFQEEVKKNLINKITEQTLLFLNLL